MSIVLVATFLGTAAIVLTPLLLPVRTKRRR